MLYNVPRELVLMLCLPSVDALRGLRPKGISPDVVSPECRCSKKSFVPRELVLMLCLPSVDALRELRPKGICPHACAQFSAM